jgi:DNA replication licensing factor MCM2
VLPQDLLRKYITFAKQTCRPRLQASDYDKIAEVYAELRRESSVSQGMPIAVRHLESMIRMSEARAAMHLREYVNDDDVDAAIRTLLDSFVSTQKLSVQKTLRRKFSRFIVAKADFNALVMFKLRECLRDARRVEQITGAVGDAAAYVVPARQLEERCRDLDITDLAPFFDSPEFAGAGFVLADAGVNIRLARA